MKLAVVVAAPCAAVIATTNAMSQTKSEKCAAYVREAARQTPATTRPARGAVRGAIGGAIVGGDIGRGAAAGAIVGGTRSAVMNSGFGHEPPR
jgi:hypothetical protein